MEKTKNKNMTKSIKTVKSYKKKDPGHNYEYEDSEHSGNDYSESQESEGSEHDDNEYVNDD